MKQIVVGVSRSYHCQVRVPSEVISKGILTKQLASLFSSPTLRAMTYFFLFSTQCDRHSSVVAENKLFTLVRRTYKWKYVHHCLMQMMMMMMYGSIRSAASDVLRVLSYVGYCSVLEMAKRSAEVIRKRHKEK